MKKYAKSAIVDIVKSKNSLSSVKFNRWLLGLLKLGFRPPANADYFGIKSACVISIDFDHLTHTTKPNDARWYPEPVERLLRLNSIGTKDMIALSEKYSIPMTWAICGRTAEVDPKSYEKILNASTPQEIGVHTYSHIDAASCSEDELKEEVAMCLEVLKLSSRPKSFVFPWNRQGHFSLLKDLEFETYRDPLRSIGAPFVNHGLVDIPPTFYVDLKSFGATDLMKNYLELCIAWNSVFHLWLHPWSVVFDSDENGKFVSQTLDPLFSFMNEKRKEGLLSICTMGELASFNPSLKNDQIISH